MAQRLFRILFWAALLFAFVMAVIPRPPEIGTSDKSQHILAFVVLTGLALLAYRRARPLAVFASMAAFGGFIEIVQGLSFVGRDADVMDWLADMLAIGAVLTAAAVVRARWLRAAATAEG